MKNIILIILGAFLIITLILLFLLYKKLHALNQPKNEQGFVLLQNQLNELTRVVDLKLTETHKSVQQQYGISTRVIQEVTEKLTKLEETNKNVASFAEQLQSLEDILKNPKQRGILGEYYLETVLKNVLPPGMYQMQYPFKNGEIVDAAVFVSDKIVPIDSKFSLENYNRLVQANETEKPIQHCACFRVPASAATPAA